MRHLINLILSLAVMNFSICCVQNSQVSDIREAAEYLQDKFESGDHEAAVDLWEMRKTFREFPELSATYPDEVLATMLDRAANSDVPKALVHRFWRDLEKANQRADVRDLEKASQEGLFDAAPEAALILSLTFNEVTAAMDLAAKYFHSLEDEVEFSEETTMSDRSKFLQILRKAEEPSRTASGESLFESGRLASAWNTWSLFIRGQAEKGQVVRGKLK